MIEKRFPRKLNKAADSRILPEDSMSDALNINVSEDVGGDGGVIKPVKSNVALNVVEDFLSGSQKTVVGKVACDKYNVLYFFVSDPDGADAIVAYDPDAYLPGSPGGNRMAKVFQHSLLDFDINGFVKADITYIQKEFETDERSYVDMPYIFFTDNKSEPKKLNVLRAITDDYSGEGINDFLFACTKAPVHPIVADVDSEAGGFDNEVEFLQNEFIDIPGFQFAYQNVYKDGFESAISAYSKVFVPPGYLRYTGQSDLALLSAYNAIDITVPDNDMSPEVDSVKIMARRGNTGSWQVIKELKYEGSDLSYTFLNNTVNSAVSNDVQSKQFDNLPPKAETQTIIDNRLMYGNYVDGFDNVELEATLAAQPSERPVDFVEYEVKIIPSVSPSPEDYEGGAQNKNIGFTIDASTLDSLIPAGSFLSFSFTVNPKQNFHVYNAKSGYHQSPQMGDDFTNEGWSGKGRGTVEDFDPGVTPGDTSQINEETGHPNGYWWQDGIKSGADFLQYQRYNYGRIPAVCSRGVNRAYLRAGDGLIETELESRFRWRYFDMTSGSSQEGDYHDVDFGTSAANPLIIQGRPFTIRASFTAKEDLTKAQVAEAFAYVMDGVMTPELSDMAENVTFPTQEELSYDINLGLNNGSTASEQSPVAKLITTVGRNFTDSEVLDGTAVGKSDEVVKDAPVKGFFILNRATVEFGIFRDEKYNEPRLALQGQHPDSESGDTDIFEDDEKPRARFGIYVKRVTVPNEEEAVLSCMRRPLPGARWFFFAPWNQDGNANTPAVENVLLGDADFREYSLFPFIGDNGQEQGGLMNNPGFGGKGHNVDSDAAPQDSIPDVAEPTSTSDREYLAISPFGENSISFQEERYIFRKNPNNPNAAPLWGSVLGGLYYSPTYAGVPNPVFFNGEAGGKSCYTLMDGHGGPGGGGVDPNSAYDTYVLWGLNGSNAEDYGVGLGSIGSVGLLGVADSSGSFNQLFDSGETDGKIDAGMRGPGLNNNIWLHPQGSEAIQIAYVNNYTQPAVEHVDDDEVTFITFSGGSSVNFNPGNPIYGLTTLPFIHTGQIGGNPGLGENNGYNDAYVYPATYYGEEGFGAKLDVNTYENLLSNPSGINEVLFVIPPGTGGKQSFKAGANHSFGIVFYDERGRASNVNPLGTVYVPWFGEREEAFTGPVEQVAVAITGGSPPPNATSFRFVYSGNTTMSRWIQYSSANAFVATESGETDSGNIFLSLNHLQGSPISFSRSKGARSLEGSQDVYTFREGDRVRIVSYYNTVNNRVFPGPEYEFNVVDQRFLNDGPDNPLYDVDQDGDLPHPSKVGPFLVLENNLNATDFTYDLVSSGENDPDSNDHGWNKRCVFEIYSPRKAAEEEELVYYEVGPVYDIAQLYGGNLSIEGGDAWFKTEAINFQTINNGVFSSLIKENSSISNFFPYNIEAQPFSTRVANSDVWGKGKVKAYIPDAARSRKEASITYSDKNNPISKINTITSFNPVKGQYKDLPSEFGDINYMINNDDSIFVIQSNRCSSVPVNRNIITDGGGLETLVAARQVLGTERYYAGNYGCDNNPESVCDIGNTVYFASKSNRQVYKFNPSTGIQVISDLGMKSYFKRLFERVEADRLNGQGEIRVVGGYDPFEDNYILSVFNQQLTETVGTTGTGEDPTDPPDDVNDGVDPTVPDDFVGGGDDTSTGDDTGVDDTTEEEEDDNTGGGFVGPEFEFPDTFEPGKDPKDPGKDPRDPKDPKDPKDPRDPDKDPGEDPDKGPNDPRDPSGVDPEDFLDGLADFVR